MVCRVDGVFGGSGFSILVATDSHFTSTAFWTLWKFTEPIALGLVVLVSFEVYDLIGSVYKTFGSAGMTLLKVAINARHCGVVRLDIG